MPTAEAHPPVDLRSDTVTRPTAAMRRAIAEAEVGDAVLGDDPTAARLETLAAERLGKERALFFPSGIMANQAAILVLGRPGTEAVTDASGHILNWEEAAAPAWAGVQLRAVPTETGHLTPEDVARAVGSGLYAPESSLLLLENTHNSAGGRILPVEQMAATAAAARERGLRVHLDGARLPNAAVAAGLPMRAWTEHADTVMISLSKGLGAPIGSILAGGEGEMERAWRARRRLGGGMRQAGIIAAAGIHALEHHWDRLAEDHARARRLAAGAAAIEGLGAPVPDTNIVMISLEDPRLEVVPTLEALAARGVRMTQFGPRRIRAVLHLDVDDAGIDRALAALAEVVAETAPA